MKLLATAIVFLLSCNIVSAQHPPIEEVVNEFFTRYDNVDPPYILRFQKRKDGWYFSVIEYTQPSEYLKVQRFWNKATNEYLSLNVPARNDNSADAIAESVETYKSYYLDQYDIDNFERYPYYGYPGWDWDIIEDFKDAKQLTDSLLESLARAYSTYALGFFSDQYGYHFLNGDPDRVILQDTVPVSISRKNKFIYYEKKAIEAFTRLQQQSPSHITKVGRIDIKVANEHLHAWSMLRMNGHEKDAEQFLTDVRYPDSLVNKAKEMLGSMKKDAIFISSGDNDTYPLWYLQYAKGYRKDIAVVNHSLLALRRYLLYMQKLYKGSLFTTTAKQFMQKDFDYALHEEGSCSTAVTLSKLPSLIKYKNERRVFECNELVKTISPTLSATLFKGKKMLPSMKIMLGRTLFINDYIVLDMIEKHFYKRPLYFAWAEQLSGLAPYLQEQPGVAGIYWLAPIKK